MCRWLQVNARVIPYLFVIHVDDILRGGVVRGTELYLDLYAGFDSFLFGFDEPRHLRSVLHKPSHFVWVHGPFPFEVRGGPLRLRCSVCGAIGRLRLDRGCACHV